MRYLKTFTNFSESLSVDILKVNLLESLTIGKDDLLSSIGCSKSEKIDLFKKFYLDDKSFPGKLDIEDLVKRSEFINALTSLKLRISDVKKTDDFQTFIGKSCKFMFIFGSEAIEIETLPNPPVNPIYLLFQDLDEIKDKNGEIISQSWSDVELYEPKYDINKFYDKLSSKRIEITDGDTNYRYETSNGNEWELEDSEKEDDVYKKVFRKEELEELINSKNLNINILT